MGLPSGRNSSKGKAPAELPSLLEQHLPKRARTLVSPLSDDDREVLTYMLAFGLHLQMLAGVVFPAQKLQQKSSSSAKVGLKHDQAFPSHSFAFLSSKSRSRAGRALSSLSAHKTSCSCDCFSCYSSFWSRWASSPNRDLLSTIIEITEMGEEDCKVRGGKESSEKQVKKRVLGKGKKCKGEKWKLQDLQGTSDCSVASESMLKTDDSRSATLSKCAASGPTSTDVLNDALWRDMCADGCGKGQVILTEARDRFCTGSVVKDNLVMGVALMEKTSRIAPSACGDVCPMVPLGHSKTNALPENEVVGSCPAQALSSTGDILQGKSNLRLHCTVKRKSNQIIPLDIEGTSIMKEDDAEFSQLGESGGGCLSPRLVSVQTRERGVLSQVFPHALCDIASRLWDLVSLGPRSYIMEHY